MLAELQRQFADEILRGGVKAGIYSKTVLGALIGALEDSFEACRATVGAEFFGAMAGRYVRSTPSRSPSLDDYGDTFADFIADFEPAQQLPYLADLARLEWARHRCSTAADSQPMDPARLAEVPEALRDSLSFKLAPGLALVASDYPIDGIWELARNPSLPNVDLDDGGVSLLVHRNGAATLHVRLQPPEHQLIELLLEDVPFGGLCERLDEPSPAPALIARAIRLGWITGLA